MNLLSFSTLILRDSNSVLTLCGIVYIPQFLLQLSNSRITIEANLLQLWNALLSASKMLMRVLHYVELWFLMIKYATALFYHL